MKIDRRHFLSGTVTALAGTAAAQVQAATARGATDLSTWAAVRDQFLLSRDSINLALMLLTSHPRPVREAIDRHRRALDEDPVTYLHANIESMEREVRNAAASYLGAKPDEVALTGNTTTGLALLYGGLPLRPKQEILTTTHDHYSTHESL